MQSIIPTSGGSTGLSYLDIEGPGTLAGGANAINFQNVHFSLVHNPVTVLYFGIAVSGSTYNAFSGNVTSFGSGFAGIFVDGGGENLLIGNNSSNGIESPQGRVCQQ